MLQSFRNHIDHNFTLLKEGKLLIAVSGGLDSVVLVHLCNMINLNIALAHCNFKLRGLESDRDEAFVCDLAEALDVEVFTQSFDTGNYAISNKLSIQMAARELRYQWFQELKNQLKFDYLLTAHHADDNLETFLINLSRGTGLEGLTGIPEINDSTIRPLLQFTREEIMEFAECNNLNWREDASNASNKYLRNKIRHEVVPILKGINPQLLQNFSKTITHLKETQSIVNDRIDKVSDDIIEVREEALEFDINKIKTLINPKAYLYELLKDYGFTEWNDVVELLDAQTGKFITSDDWRLLKNRDVLVLSQNKLINDEIIEILDFDNPIESSIGILEFKEVSEINKGDSNSIYVDKDLIKTPLLIRKKQDGDMFVPFGMKGSKKVSKFFKDEKYSLFEKEKTLMLCQNEKIIWIIGRRADNRFRVTESTKSILKISLV